MSTSRRKRRSPEEAREAVLADEAAASVLRQRDIEAADDISLDEYLQRYFRAY